MHVPLLIILLATVGTMMAGAWYAGEGAYRDGVAQEPITGPGPGSYTEMRNPADGSDHGQTVQHPQTLKEKVEWAAPPIQVHVLVAGLIVSLAAVSLGLSLRRAATYVTTQQADDWFAAQQSTEPLPAAATVPPPATLGGEPIVRTERLATNPGDPALAGVAVWPVTPASRFWILTTVLRWAPPRLACGWRITGTGRPRSMAPRLRVT